MNDYWTAFSLKDRKPKPAISYGDWLTFSEEQFERIKKMTEEDIKEIYGVNPNILSPDHKFNEQVEKSMKDWGKQTYAKDEGKEPFTLEGLQKLWKIIERGQKLYKYLMEKAMTMTFTEFKEFYEGFKRRNPKLFKGEKDLKTLIIKNVETGKHYKIEGSKVFKEKVGNKIYYVTAEGIHFCKIVKIIDRVKKAKGVVFSEFANWELPDPNTINKILESLKQTPGAVMEFKSTRVGKNYIYRLYEEIKKEKEKERKEKEELSRLHKRLYFITRVDIVKGKPLGKENLDEIKFPCFCTFKSGDEGPEHYGQLNKGFDGKCELYELHCIDVQTLGYSRVDEDHSLKALMDEWKIEIVKGEIQLWKEI